MRRLYRLFRPQRPTDLRLCQLTKRLPGVVGQQDGPDVPAEPGWLIVMLLETVTPPG